jgi:hypothetical protein
MGRTREEILFTDPRNADGVESQRTGFSFDRFSQCQERHE